MKQISLPDDIYQSLETIAAEKGQTIEATIAAMLMDHEWEAHADNALHGSAKSKNQTL